MVKLCEIGSAIAIGRTDTILLPQKHQNAGALIGPRAADERQFLVKMMGCEESWNVMQLVSNLTPPPPPAPPAAPDTIFASQPRTRRSTLPHLTPSSR